MRTIHRRHACAMRTLPAAYTGVIAQRHSVATQSQNCVACAYSKIQREFIRVKVRRQKLTLDPRRK